MPYFLDAQKPYPYISYKYIKTTVALDFSESLLPIG
jgi:hypothetical protein